jgi:hypothetical protein
VKAADWIQLAAVIISLGATVAAWFAAASARDSAKQTRAAQLIEFERRRLDRLVEVYAVIEHLPFSGDAPPGLTAKLDVVGLPLRESKRIAGIYERGGGVPQDEIDRAVHELHRAIMDSNAIINALRQEQLG